MKGLDAVIRLHRWQLDEKRRKLANLERLRADLDQQGARLDKDMAIEAELVSNSRAEMRLGYTTWLEAAMLRRKTIEASLANISAQVASTYEEVTAAFQETKKFETLAESRKRQAQANAARIEQAGHDETGVDQFRRRRG